MNLPLRFVPFLRPMVWGGRRLHQVLGKTLPTAEPYGEAWDVTDHPLHRSVVAEGEFAGTSLRQLMERERDALLGPAAAAYDTFPWLIKYLDACDWLSVQVHPDETAVRRLWPGEGSKTEAWFVLDAAPGSRIYAGLLPGTDEARLRDALRAGTVTECLHQFEPRPGDCIFLPAGTVHAVGGGVLMAEVQQTSDATFRLFDWNRRDAQGKARQLHVEESLASIHWDRGPVTPVHVPQIAQFHAGLSVSQPVTQGLVRCPFFTLTYQQETGRFSCGGLNRLQAWIVLHGRGAFATPKGRIPLAAGEVWVLPAAMPPVDCLPEPALAVLVSTL